MTLQEELSLANLAKNGEKPAVSALWDAITPKLYGYLLNTLRNPSLAEDILQETWLKALSALPKFEIRNIRFSAWLFAIARNECRQHWRRNNRESAWPETELVDMADKLRFGEIKSDNIFLNELLCKLTSEDQDILRLRYICDLSFKEIARILEISQIAARVRIHRAISRARDLISDNQTI
ncbi:MAG: RNA polymerase sigma factor [Candidatus Magasanikbacteria bacterium]|nr:RNA polymerase sigma factor [Candidatus Magasanikbacteria bacterium]